MHDFFARLYRMRSPCLSLGQWAIGYRSYIAWKTGAANFTTQGQPSQGIFNSV
ncbi:MAG: hypothetical protein AAGD25_30420 [Cyanobacteria bacterium P01_F01_bin.150]